MDFLSQMLVLAEGEQARQPGAAEALGPMLPYFVAMAFIFYFMFIRPQARERKTRETMMSNLKRNDRVVTYSGIIGTITGFSDDNKEVTLRVDDSVKLRFLRSAIQGPLGETPAADASKPAGS